MALNFSYRIFCNKAITCACTSLLQSCIYSSAALLAVSICTGSLCTRNCTLIRCRGKLKAPYTLGKSHPGPLILVGMPNWLACMRGPSRVSSENDRTCYIFHREVSGSGCIFCPLYKHMHVLIFRLGTSRIVSEALLYNRLHYKFP